MHPTSPVKKIEVVPATPEQQPVLGRLLELYVQGFSEFHHVELGEDGRFDYPGLPLYWSESTHHPFLINVDGKLAGFAFVIQGSRFSADQGVWDMAEFFVLDEYRRRGIGTRAAHKVLWRFSGRWEVRVMEANASAIQFWQHAVSAFTGEEVHSTRFERMGETWRLFSFES